MMKRFLSLAFTVVFIFAACLCATAAAETRKVSISVECEENLVFSKYDVDLFLDGEKMATIEHGKRYNGSFSAEDGDHIIWFYQHNKQSKAGSIHCTISGDTSVRCKIHCSSSKIDVEDVVIEAEAAPEPAQMSRSMNTDTDETEETPETVPEQTEPVQEAPAKSDNGVWLDFNTATDEELQEGLEKIKAEQRARMKTKLVPSSGTLTIGKGKSEKLTLEIQDLPEGVKAGKINAETSDKAVAVFSNNTIKAVGTGNATITFTCELSDGTEISAECKVNVIVPIKSITPVKKNIELGVGDNVVAEYKIAPADASGQNLSFSSTDTSVAKVTSSGLIHAEGVGTATITAKSTDGSGVSGSITVKVTKSDDVGKTKITKGGVSVKLVRYRETTGSSFTKADAGKTYVLLEFLIENNSSKEINISSVLSFDGYCDGYTSDYSFGAAMNADQTLDGSIAPGKKMKGQIGYEVSKGWKEIEVHVKPDYWGGDDLPFVVVKK